MQPGTPPQLGRARGHRRRHGVGAESGPVPTRHGYVRARDGTRLFYGIEGEPAFPGEPPLVFCYGLVCSTLHWTYQVDFFRQRRQTIWFDYRGHGSSDRPRDLASLTLDTLVDDLETLLDELGVGRVILLGHSMGVNVVLEFARRRPERLAGMVLANGTPARPLESLMGTSAFRSLFGVLATLHRAKPAWVERVWRHGQGNALVRVAIGLGGFNPHLTPPEDIAQYVDQVAAMDPEVLIRLIGSYERLDATPWLNQLGTPTLIISGEQDRVTPLAKQELMHQLLPDSELVVIRHGSHCPQLDLPDVVNLAIDRFVARLGPPVNPSH